MKITRITIASFSPCGHTLEYARQMTYAIRERLPEATCQELNLTPLSAQEEPRSFSGEDLVLLCAPVYGGRIPTPGVARFGNLAAQNAPAILIATYGNRDFDDALLELAAIARNQGFWPVGAAACVAQHTLASECASGRPTEADVTSAMEFAASIESALAADAIPKEARLEVPGNPQLREFKPFPLPQTVNENCIMCGRCWSNCPTGAITVDFPAQVDKSQCIACMACVCICPTGARIPDEAFLKAIQEKLATLCAVPKKNEYFTI